MKLQLPLPSAVVVLERTPSRKTLTSESASAVPVKVGVASWVRLSVLEEPVSLPASRSGVAGAAGAVASMVQESVALLASGLVRASAMPEPAALSVKT